MMRSELRGLGRGALPKRSRSARGPPVCMSSIAQQARPKSRYQTELARPQLRSQLSALSTVVLMTEPVSSPYLASIPLGGAFNGLATGGVLLLRNARTERRAVVAGGFQCASRAKPSQAASSAASAGLGP